MSGFGDLPRRGAPALGTEMNSPKNPLARMRFPAYTPHMKTDLTPEQRTVVDALHSWTAIPDKVPFLLSGCAGVGKTYTLGRFSKETDLQVLFCAPTHKAVRVLRDSLKSCGVWADCLTIHRALGLAVGDEDEHRSLVPTGKGCIKDYDVVVIDEASMIDTILWGWILRWSGRPNAAGRPVSFILVGDVAQLPPVREAYSPAFTLDPRAELLTVMRHDNEILEVSQAARACVFNGRDLSTRMFRGRGVTHSNRDSFLESILPNLDDFDGCKVLAWTNVAVDGYIRDIRKILLGSKAASAYCVGERVTFVVPCRYLDYIVDKRGNERQISRVSANTEEEGTVVDVSVGINPSAKYDVLCYILQIRKDIPHLDGSFHVTAYVVHPDGRKAYNKHKKRMLESVRRGVIDYPEYHLFTDMFTKVRSAYATTVHKSQGSTYRRAYVDVGDIRKNRDELERRKCLYVACSRAKEELIFL